MAEGRRAALRVVLGISLLLGGVAALTPAACGNCQAGCTDGTITFALSAPLAGQDFAITVMPPSASAFTIDCRPGDASAGCAPTSAINPHLDAQGSLQSADVSFLGVGQYRFQVTVDGVPTVDATFRYDLGRYAGLCGSSCYPGTTFQIQNP